MNKKILYVYYGTFGTAGAYIHNLLTEFQKYQCKLYAAVSYYYKFLTPNVSLLKIFFKYTDTISDNKYLDNRFIRNFRKPIRYIELIYGYIKTVVFVILYKIDIVNVSLIDNHWATVFFIIALKCLPVKLYVTAHDVISHDAKENKLYLNRIIIFRLADKVIVHNEKGKYDLINSFSIPESKVVIHEYPKYDFRAVIDNEKYEKVYHEISKKIYKYSKVYLYIGYIRFDKGVDILVDEWTEFMSSSKDCLLMIVGKPTLHFNALDNLESKVNGCSNISFIKRRVSDEEYMAYIQLADIIVLPYRHSTHSAVFLSSYTNASKCVIGSNIPTFQEFIDETNGYMFSLEVPHDLGRILLEVKDTPREELRRRGENGRGKIELGLNQLSSHLGKIYGLRPI